MPAKNLRRVVTKDSYCHAYNKAVEGRNIFNDEEDYKVFTDYLKGYVSAPVDPKNVKQTFIVKGKSFKGTPHQPKNYFGKLEIKTYSLMPDHFHLLLHQLEEGSVEKFIRSLCTRYSMYFNKKYKRTGALFNGPYRSLHLDTDEKIDLLTKYLDNKKFQAKNEEKELLQTIAFDNHDIKLERRILQSEGQIFNVEKELKKSKSSSYNLRIPEIFAAVIIFVVLFSLGINNINVSASTSKPTELSVSNNSSAILGMAADIPQSSTPTPTPSPVPTATPQPTLSSITDLIAGTKSAEVKIIKKTLKVNITDGSSTVNIRKDPSISSEVVTKAKDGDSFEFLSVQSGWYRVLLTDGTGYISLKYIKVLESTN